jgi:DNA polymerase
VTKGERQIGKVQELALGYQGGPGAFMNMAANYGIKPHEIAVVVRAATSDAEWQAVRSKFDESNGFGLSPDDWTGLKIVVNQWRAANANIVQGWWDLQDAAVEAVGSPGIATGVYGGRVRYLAANGFLFCSLPSKRVLAYCAPRLIETERNGRKRYVVEYDGADSKTKTWGKQTLYGGEQCNHVVQGTARDLMVEAMFHAEAAGFPVILTVHDELLCEVRDDPTLGGTPDSALLQAFMSELPDWAEGLPLAAAAWEDYRYVK